MWFRRAKPRNASNFGLAGPPTLIKTPESMIWAVSATVSGPTEPVVDLYRFVIERDEDVPKHLENGFGFDDGQIVASVHDPRVHLASDVLSSVVERSCETGDAVAIEVDRYQGLRLGGRSLR